MPGGKQQHHDSQVEGRIVASYGRRYLVELPDTTVLDCVTRGKRGDVACGDRVSVARSAPGQGVIEAIAPRMTLLYRSDAYRQKLIAANVTQIIIVVAAVPTFSEDLVNRCLIAAEYGGMKALIALNKSDLPESAAALSSLEFYRALGYRVRALSARRDVQPLCTCLENEVSALVGQSGMGKSTIINRLVPGAAARVAEVSAALDSGRHTTTYARLYHLNATSCIIDSPGMQEFGLHHLNCDDAAHAFVEFRPWLGRCRFRDCRHLSEPDCAIATACSDGNISERRLASYRRLAEELNKAPTYRNARNRR
ncbi:MAG: ribosome small subunit-dependent GTPase A [Betaproteobacteria bacterium RIFCSPLOWO2_02_FULL_62_79]|nr:MAG: ribosome small subunit-dependent GTPase A [Betaproteobacteria bacterium RIFCSPLOWO2_02_FULL_62_79]